MNAQFLTGDGHQQLRSQLEYLRTVKRTEAARYMREVVEAGNTTGNAAFEDAKFEQIRLEGRIAELEQLLATAEIVPADKGPTTIVSLGSTVQLELSDGRVCRYSIVGSYEADPSAGRISHQSPVGRALLGHKVGDRALAATPGGVKEYTILAIE